MPDDIDAFATVKGIGRKSANMIVGLAYGKPAIIVDTHMTRVSGRIGLTKNEDAGQDRGGPQAARARSRTGPISPCS